MDRRSFLGSLGTLVIAPRVAVEACVKVFDPLPTPAIVKASGCLTVAQAQMFISNMLDESLAEEEEDENMDL